MKQCPLCNRVYSDESLNFCLEDGTALNPADPSGEAPTALNIPEIPSESPSRQRVHATDATTAVLSAERMPRTGSQNRKLFIIAAVAGYVYLLSRFATEVG